MDNIITEAYYGKLPEFETIEKCLDKIIIRVKKEGFAKANPNKYPEMKTINKLFCKIFGFKNSYIYWEPDNGPNGATVTMGAYLIYTDKSKYIEKTDRGFYDKTGTTVLTVYTSLGIIRLGLTSREILSVILHEIGHNFDMSDYQKIEFFGLKLLHPELKELKEYMLANPEKARQELEDIKLKSFNKNTKKMDKLYGNAKKRQKELDLYKPEKYGKIIERVDKRNMKFTPLYLLDAVFSPIINVGRAAFPSYASGKKGELFADSFATAYGYGTELISGLNKMNSEMVNVNPKSPSKRFFRTLSEFYYEVSSNIDVHGSNMERCQECIEKLKWDLRHNDFPPELKRELVNEINSLTHMYKEFSRLEPNERYVLLKLYRKFVKVTSNGKRSFMKFLPRNKV